MARELARERFGALLIPDPRVALWSAESSYTQRGPRAGVPTTTSRSRMFLGASGVQTAGASMLVRVQWPGFASRESGYDTGLGLAYAHGAAAIWQDVATSVWFGYDPAGTLATAGIVLWGDTVAAPERARDPSVLGLQSGVLLCVAQVEDSAADVQYGIEILTAPADGAIGLWARGPRPFTDTTSGDRYRPVMLQLPDGTVHAYHVIRDSSSGTAEYQVRMHYSNDDGATWAYGGDVLEDEITDAPDRLRIAYGNGQVVLFIDTAATPVETLHYASADLGQTFQHVETLVDPGVSPPHDPGSSDVTFGPAGFVVVVAGYEAATGMYVFVIGDAFDRISEMRSAGAYTLLLGSVALTEGTTFVEADETGAVYAGGVVSGTLFVVVSYDGGLVWSAFFNPDSEGTIYLGSSSDYLDRLSSTVHNGRIVLVSQWEASTAAATETGIMAVYLGGWTSIPMPTHKRTQVETVAVRCDLNWLPVELLQDTGAWTAAGTGSELLATPGVQVVSLGVGDTRYYHRTPTVTAGKGVGLRVVIAPQAGTTSVDEQSIMLRLDNGVYGFEVSIRFSTTQWQLYDVNAAANIGSAQSYTGPLDIRIWMSDGGLVSTESRTWDHASARAWTAGPSSNGLTDSGGTAGSNRIEIGQRAAAPLSTGILFYEVGVVDGDAVGQGLWTPQTSPADLRGRLLSGSPYIGQGVTVQAHSGPGYRGDEWTIATRYDYGVDRATDESSPRLTTRSLDTTQQVYAFRWDDSTNENTEGDSGLLGIILPNCNWSEVAISLYLQGTGWVSFGTAERYRGLESMPVTVSGSSARPSSGVGPYLQTNEYAGGTVCFGTTYGRRIARHTAGAMRGGRGVRPVIVFEGATGSEAGDATIIPSSTTILVDTKGVAYSGVKLTVPDAATTYAPAEDYYECGGMVIGWVHPFGLPYSWGRTIEYLTGVEVNESPDRMSRSRVLAPMRRVFSVGWLDGIDQSEIERRDSDPSFFTPSMDGGARADSSSAAGTATLLSGLMRSLDSPHTVLGLLPSVEQGGGIRVLNRWQDHALVRLDSPIRIENRQGDELLDEVVNVATVTAREEV